MEGQNETRSKHPNMKVLEQSCRFPAPHNRTSGQNDNSPRRALKSPKKPIVTRTTSPEDVQQAQAKQQRSLKLLHVDSLLLHPVARVVTAAPPSMKESDAVRASPTRRVKHDAQRERIKRCLGEDSGIEVAESEWNYSDISSEGDSSFDEETSVYPQRPPNKINRSPQKKPLSKELESASFIDLTSPRKQSSKVQSTKHVYGPRPLLSASSSDISDSEPAAIIRFSPPQFKRPFKKPAVSESRARTPSPPPSPSKARLTSPSKKCRIPPTPHRPSIDAFWNPDVVNAWNEEYSPKKSFQSPRKLPLPDSSDDEDYFTPSTSPRKSSPQKKSPTKRDRAKTEAKKLFEREKHSIAESFLKEMETKIGRGRISTLTEATGGVKIIWSKKLNSTAGRANWKREGTKSRDASGEIVTTYKHTASIELAEKVIDDEHRLLNVLAHEYCHLLNFMVSNIRDQPHGASFKGWASEVTEMFADRGIEVTTKHSYEIVYKYAWTCASDDCATEYERHSKSIDPARHTCGKCRGKLVQMRPVPRGSSKDGNAKPKQESAYQKFVKDQFAIVRKELDESRGGEKSPMKDVMKEVGSRYRRGKLETSGKGSANSQDKQNEVGVEQVEGDDGAELAKISRKLDFLTINSDN